MNEKIRALAEQAGYKPLPGFDFANSLEEIYLEKFAELIVREVFTKIEDERFEVYQPVKESWDEIVSDEDIAQERDPLIREYLKGNNQGIVDVVIKFRNHFGVEE